jgi:hypothetical protein
MNREDALKLITICSANYRNWPEPGKETAMVDLWTMMLRDMPLEVAQAAVMTHMSQSVFPPTVADIRGAAEKITSPNRLEAIEAWDLIIRAIRNYGYYREVEAMASLPPEVADMARRFTWESLCTNDNPDTLRAQFRMAWETQAKRQREDRLIAPQVMQLIENSGAVKKLPFEPTREELEAEYDS